MSFSNLDPKTDTHGADDVRRQGKGGHLRAGGGGPGQILPLASEGPVLLRATLISDPRPPEPGEDMPVLFQPRGWGHSATAAPGHSELISPFLDI